MKLSHLTLKRIHRAQNTGKLAEQLAYDFLLQHGLHNMQRNYRCRLGEIDLIFKDPKQHPTLVIFIEVRLKQHTLYGNALDSITSSKQRKIIFTAQHFLKQYFGSEDIPCRFDVIGFSPATDFLHTNRVYNINNKAYALDWLQDAFDAPY